MSDKTYELDVDHYDEGGRIIGQRRVTLCFMPKRGPDDPEVVATWSCTCRVWANHQGCAHIEVAKELAKGTIAP